MKRLFIDLEQCAKCEDCGMTCSYNYHPRNVGITPLRERANFALVCRRCTDAPCVNACPWEALERQDDGILKRYSMRCTSCKSCANACPFGTIYPETIPFLFSGCDLCMERLGNGEAPVCVSSCAHNGVRYGEFDEDRVKGVYKVSERLVVSSEHWSRELPMVVKR